MNKYTFENILMVVLWFGAFLVTMSIIGSCLYSLFGEGLLNQINDVSHWVIIALGIAVVIFMIAGLVIEIRRDFFKKPSSNENDISKLAEGGISDTSTHKENA